MFQRIRLTWLAVLAVGAGLGFMAARNDLPRQSHAASIKPLASARGVAEAGARIRPNCGRWPMRTPPLPRSSRRYRLQASGKKPNILIIWGDDIGWNNPSAYHRGMMGYSTPNIDRVAKEGGLFHRLVRPAIVHGRAGGVSSPGRVRSAPGCSKSASRGRRKASPRRTPRSPGLLKNHGYMTAQYGKNHLGDRDEHLPTNHGFDEFYGNLYHLNAEQEPEHPDYFKRPRAEEEVRPSRRHQVLRRREDHGHRAADHRANEDGRRRDHQGRWTSWTAR